MINYNRKVLHLTTQPKFNIFKIKKEKLLWKIMFYTK